jgi:paraquat-inducible protein A
MRSALPFLLFAATFCFALGIALLMRVERRRLFSDEPSLGGIIAGLRSKDDEVLAAIVALFSLVFPMLKLAILHVAAVDGPEGHRLVPPMVQGAVAPVYARCGPGRTGHLRGISDFDGHGFGTGEDG